jgi:hypothetical protein
MLRANIENQILSHLSPFTDMFLSDFAYDAIPWLGKSLRFQMDLLKNINYDLASVNSNYGFPFSKDEPFIRKAKVIGKDFIPKSIFFKINQKLKRKTGTLSGISQRLINEIPLSTKITELELPIRINTVFKNSELNPLVFQINFFTDKILFS